MNYYYLNKIAMAVLVALLLFFGARTLVNIAFEEHEPEKPGFEVAGSEEEPDGKAEKPAGGGDDIIAALQTADPAQGEKDVALCKVCHSFEKGGATLIGPDLYGVVGHKIASHEGFAYTDALKSKDGNWTFENLDHWLANPQAFAAGTSMAFPGIPDLKKRADVIAYLNKNSDNPLPIPEPKAEAAPAKEAAAAPAGEEASGADKFMASGRQSRSGQGRGRRRALQGVPYRRQGRRNAGRAKSLGRGRPQDRGARGLYLYARAQKA